jgi:23S rRNA pseudouridine1911/1915/1917 synthase
MKLIVKNETGRLDVFLADKLELSRSSLQKLITAGQILLNEKPTNASAKVQTDDVVEVDLEVRITKEANDLIIPKIVVVKKTKDYLIINKPAGLIVHNTQHMAAYTLVDWLLQNYPKIEGVGEDALRPGIVHRLDKDVSGLMVIARTQDFFDNLKIQFGQRTVHKKYQGLAYGSMDQNSGRIDFPIARATDGHKMAARPANAEGRVALTEFLVLEHYINYTLLELTIKTGRTHQIRAHCAAINHPLVGDNLYGTKMTRIKNKRLDLGRVWLCATELSFNDAKGKLVEFTIGLPAELQTVLKAVK